MEFLLSLEVVVNEDGVTFYLGDYCDGSYIKVTAKTPEEAVDKLKPYILDYFN